MNDQSMDFSPMDCWDKANDSHYHGSVYHDTPYRDCFREQDGYADVQGRMLHYWLYDTSSHDGDAAIIYNEVLPAWVEKQGYAIDFGNIYESRPNTALAQTVRKLMRECGCNISMALVDEPPHPPYALINEFFAVTNDYKFTEYPLREGQQQSRSQAMQIVYEPIIGAAENNNVERVKELLANGADPDAKDMEGRTALMSAARKGYADAVRLLLNAGANPDIQSNNGFTALMIAANNGYAECVNALLAGGANPDIKSKYDWTALMVAAGKGHTECVKALLEAGANPDIQDNNGWTALIVAASDICVITAIVKKIILKMKAKSNVQNEDGHTALSMM